MAPDAHATAAPPNDTDHSPDDLIALSDLVLAETLRHLARYGGVISEQDGLLLFRGPHPHANPYRNGVLCLNTDFEPAEVIRRGRSFFEARGSSFVLWSREHADANLATELDARGFAELERIPGMFRAEISPRLPVPDGLELRPVSDAVTSDDFLRVNAAAWGLEDTPRALAAELLFDPAAAVAPNASAYLAYHDGRPVAACMGMMVCGAMTALQAATIPSARRRGFGTAVAQAPMYHLKDTFGGRHILMQTSSSGQPAWMKLGYIPITAYRRHVVTPDRTVLR